MSVQRNYYKVVGCKFEYDEYHDLIKPVNVDGYYFEEWLERKERPFIDSAFNGIIGNDHITVIADGMNGEYVVIGNVFEKSGNWVDGATYTAEKLSCEKVEHLIEKHFGLCVKTSEFEFFHYR